MYEHQKLDCAYLQLLKYFSDNYFYIDVGTFNNGCKHSSRY